MKRPPQSVTVWCGLFALAAVACAGFTANRDTSISVVITGDVQGYLSPCGCSSPMLGGIRRLATALSRLRGENGLFLVNGGLINPTPANGTVGAQQNELKAETLGEAFASMHVDAVNVGDEEASGGPNLLAELKLLDPGKLVSTSLAENATTSRWIESGPFIIGGVAGNSVNLGAIAGTDTVTEERAAHDLAAAAQADNKTPILLLRDSRAEAEMLAKAEPRLRLIVFQGAGSATAPVTVGKTLLVCPGDRTRELVRVKFDGDGFGGQEITQLNPDIPDDPAVSALFFSYLRRVEHSQLIEALPRTETKAFAGPEACQSCHAAAYSVWHDSAHAHALKDLENSKQARDPDCLECHVTGLDSTVGFRTRATTASLANVTCESCHGPAAEHAASPKTVRLPKIGKETCLSCHTADNSPNFSFDPYWARVMHQ